MLYVVVDDDDDIGYDYRIASAGKSGQLSFTTM